MSVSQLQDRRDSPLLRVPKEHRKDWRAFMHIQMGLPESDTRWKGMCESLQRQAHDFDAAFASAYAHMVATPLKERMDPREAPVSSYIFVDDPNDSNAYGHIVGKWANADKLADIPVVTNDVNDAKSTYDPGNVTVVPLGWFPQHWGDGIKFATTWFGGTEIPTYVPESAQEDTAAWVKVAIERARAVTEMMRKALRDNDEKAHPRHERALQREIDDQKRIITSLQGLLP